MRIWNRSSTESPARETTPGPYTLDDLRRRGPTALVYRDKVTGGWSVPRDRCRCYWSPNVKSRPLVTSKPSGCVLGLAT